MSANAVPDQTINQAQIENGTETEQEIPTTNEPEAQEATDNTTSAVETPAAADTVQQAAGEESAPVSNGKTSPKLRLFNPFAKSVKKEDGSGKEEVTEETPVPPSSTSTEQPKAPERRKSKGFGSLFFSRNKCSSPKNEETQQVSAAETGPVELPQIEQLQPIETSTVVNQDGESNLAVTTTPAAGGENEEHAAAAEASDDQSPLDAEKQVATETIELPVGPSEPKRQSFISKLFSKKKEDRLEVKEESQPQETAQPDEQEEEQQQQQQPAQEESAAPASEESKEIDRPSSPLGRLTELFSKIPRLDKKPTSTSGLKSTSAVEADAEIEAEAEAETPKTQPPAAAEEETPAAVETAEDETEHATATAVTPAVPITAPPAIATA
ncbi:hypothetical protein EC973_008525 [Apophysomyces ossiformis]|uniref:Uncharacterized protein n=1 Tax=Apophysomyces ossiformis TaxID=679940 RepID=A0A8H7EQ77_9FUNG|nr:hypothetical protein EC973_008525 [Apophysomyces ossiformis]